MKSLLYGVVVFFLLHSAQAAELVPVAATRCAPDRETAEVMAIQAARDHARIHVKAEVLARSGRAKEIKTVKSPSTFVPLQGVKAAFSHKDGRQCATVTAAACEAETFFLISRNRCIPGCLSLKAHHDDICYDPKTSYVWGPIEEGLGRPLLSPY